VGILDSQELVHAVAGQNVTCAPQRMDEQTQQRCTLKSPLLWPPSRTELGMGRAMHLRTTPQLFTAHAGRQSLSGVLSPGCSQQGSPPAAQPTKIASSVAAIPHGALHGSCLAPVRDRALAPLPGACGGVRRFRAAGESTRNPPRSTRSAPPFSSCGSTMALGASVPMKGTPQRDHPPSPWRCPGAPRPVQTCLGRTTETFPRSPGWAPPLAP
jgi:hypothetical protein